MMETNTISWQSKYITQWQQRNYGVFGFRVWWYIYILIPHIVTNHTNGELLSCPKDTQIPKKAYKRLAFLEVRKWGMIYSSTSVLVIRRWSPGKETYDTRPASSKALNPTQSSLYNFVCHHQLKTTKECHVGVDHFVRDQVHTFVIHKNFPHCKCNFFVHKIAHINISILYYVVVFTSSERERECVCVCVCACIISPLEPPSRIFLIWKN
jgi:hypothetical protein